MAAAEDGAAEARQGGGDRRGPVRADRRAPVDRRGYDVTVFERMPRPGGMMTYGIPAYRLPREALFAEIDHIWRRA